MREGTGPSMSAADQPAEHDAGALPALVARYGDLVRRAIVPYLHGGDGAVSRPGGAAGPQLGGFYGMMAYHLGWVDASFSPQPGRAGKSIRPVLCLLLAEALGGSAADCAALAAGIELLHNFTLIHDDIEDRSPTRRGRPAAWMLWGEAQAINTGDGLYALTHLVWLGTPLARRDPAGFIEILSSLERTILALCEGQYLDIGGEGSLEIAAADYYTMIGRKTAALLGESAWVGARAAGADERAGGLARSFGHELGLSFQIRDDLLGIWGAEEETGKSASSDIATRKMTLPVILALEHGPTSVREALRRRYGSPPEGEDDADQVRALLAEAGADRLAAAREEEHWQAAMRALADLPVAPDWRERLARFAAMLVARRA